MNSSSKKSPSDLTTKLAEALVQIDALITTAADKLRQAGPDNPGIVRLSQSAFMGSRSALGNQPGGGTSWNVFDHDWLAQYRFARKLVETRRFAVLSDLLSGVQCRDAALGPIRFAPEVIEHVKSIVGDLRFAKPALAGAPAVTSARRRRP